MVVNDLERERERLEVNRGSKREQEIMGEYGWLMVVGREIKGWSDRWVHSGGCGRQRDRQR